MIHALRRFIATVAAIALALGLGGWLIDRNVFQSQAMLSAIHRSDTCQQIATAAPNVLAQALTLPAASLPLLNGVVTSSYVCDRLDQILPQFEAYYRKDGSPPQIDLRDLQVRLINLGVPIPPTLSQQLAAPIVYQNERIDAPLKQISQTAQRGLGLSLVIALAGMVLVWLLGAHKRWQAMAAVPFMAAFILVMEAGLVKLLPTLITSPVASSWLSALAPSFKQLTTSVTDVASSQLLIGSGVLLVAALLLYVIGMVTGWRHRRPARPSSLTLAEQDDKW